MIGKQKLMLLKQRQNSHFHKKNVPNTFGGRAPPGPAGGAHTAPPDRLAGLKGAALLRGRGGEGGDGKGVDGG
jgi:hypothetical protein